MDKVTVFQGYKTGKNSPGFWERRTSKMFLTSVELICGGNFEPKKPIFLNRTEKLDADLHVLFVANIGDIIAKAYKTSKQKSVIYEFYVITGFGEADGYKIPIYTELIKSANSLADFSDEYSSSAAADFVAAIENKLESEVRETFYSEPHNLHERIAEMRATK